MDTKKLRQKILDLAIHGKLVPQDPNDEPASVLLERIRAEKEQLIKEGKIKKSRKASSSSDTPHYEQVPNGWSLCRIGDVCSFENGYAFSSHDYKESGVPLIRISNIADNQINIEQCVYIQGPVNERFSVKKGDLLIALSGATTGKMGVYNLDKKAYLNQRVGNLRIKHHELIISEFRDYVMMAKSEEILKLAYGGAQPNISGAVICEMELLLPPLSEQIRIINELKQWLSIINSLDNGKENLRAIINQAKIKILDIAVHGKLVPQDLNDEPASELLKRINPKAEITCDNAHYLQLPKSWCLVQLQDLCSLYDGEKRSNHILPYIDVKYLRGGKAAEMVASGKFVKKGSLLILVDGENSGEVFLSSCDGYQGSTFKQLKINNNVYEEYVLLVIQMSRKMLRENKVGSAIPHLDKKIFRAIQVYLPPYQEQIRIVEEVAKLNRLLDTIKESL